MAKKIQEQNADPFSKALHATIAKHAPSTDTITQLLPSGLPLVDWCTHGGIPYGMITEIAGASQTAKTTLAIIYAAQAQKHGFHVLFMDYEKTYNEKYATAFGLDVSSNFSLAQPPTAESGLEIIVKAFSASVENNKPLFIIIDSVPAMTPSKEVEEGETQPMASAKFNASFLRVMTSRCQETNSICVLVNHVREVIGGQTGWGATPTKSAGGSFVPYVPAVRLKLSSAGETLKKDTPTPLDPNNKTAINAFVKVQCIKHKVGRPNLVGYFSVLLGKRIWDDYMVAKFCPDVEGSIFKKSGAFYTIAPDPTGQDRWQQQRFQGMGALLVWLKDKQEVVARGMQELLTAFESSQEDVKALTD